MDVTFKFKGTVEVKADTAKEAKEIADSDFGLVIGSAPHSSNMDVLDWDFDMHPEKSISNPKRHK
jgi:hypothetical protein